MGSFKYLVLQVPYMPRRRLLYRLAYFSNKSKKRERMPLKAAVGLCNIGMREGKNNEE